MSICTFKFACAFLVRENTCVMESYQENGWVCFRSAECLFCYVIILILRGYQSYAFVLFGWVCVLTIELMFVSTKYVWPSRLER
jgi:hypothetical protein